MATVRSPAGCGGQVTLLVGPLSSQLFSNLGVAPVGSLGVAQERVARAVL